MVLVMARMSTMIPMLFAMLFTMVFAMPRMYLAFLFHLLRSQRELHPRFYDARRCSVVNVQQRRSSTRRQPASKWHATDGGWNQVRLHCGYVRIYTMRWQKSRIH